MGQAAQNLRQGDPATSRLGNPIFEQGHQARAFDADPADRLLDFIIQGQQLKNPDPPNVAGETAC